MNTQLGNEYELKEIKKPFNLNGWNSTSELEKIAF